MVSVLGLLFPLVSAQVEGPPLPVFPHYYKMELPRSFLWPHQSVLVNTESRVVVSWYGDSQSPSGLYQISSANACFQIDNYEGLCAKNPLKCSRSFESFDFDAIFRSNKCRALAADSRSECNIWACDIGGIDVLLCITSIDQLLGYSVVKSIYSVPVKFTPLDSFPTEAGRLPSSCQPSPPPPTSSWGGGGGFQRFSPPQALPEQEDQGEEGEENDPSSETPGQNPSPQLAWRGLHRGPPVSGVILILIVGFFVGVCYIFRQQLKEFTDRLTKNRVIVQVPGVFDEEDGL